MSNPVTGIFRKYRLVVGEDLPENLVHESDRMPAFHPPPKVVVWGARFFVLASPADAETLVYREELAWFSGVEAVAEEAPAAA